MAFATTDDGVRLYYEETGSGTPIIFVHEFAGDHRSWEPQMRHFGQRYRAITYAARGYPPSDVPGGSGVLLARTAPPTTSWRCSIISVSRGRMSVGLSMGGFATLHFGFRHPSRALSLCVAGCGYGAELNSASSFAPRPTPMVAFAAGRRHGRVCRAICLWPDPRAVRRQGPARLCRVQAGSWPSIPRWARVNTQLGCQQERPSLYRSAERDGRPDRADADPDRRRGLALPDAGGADEAHDPVGGALGDAELRARDQSRGRRTCSTISSATS